jgi:lipoprotein-anchoring transpeptidase ErfK/SrfK
MIKNTDLQKLKLWLTDGHVRKIPSCIVSHFGPVLKKALLPSVYILFIPFLLFITPVIAELAVPVIKVRHELSDDASAEKRVKTLKTQVQALERRIERLTPGNAYLVVNTTENRFALYKNRQLIREGLCSTGSMISLEGEGDQKWFFRTPRGDYRVITKLENPIWRKPDWAFVEEGLPVPPANHPSRFERGVLGDYALTLGDGYMIHGTLYQRFIGLPVTHGCIRMLDDDLEVVYRTLPAGAKVFIY